VTHSTPTLPIRRAAAHPILPLVVVALTFLAGFSALASTPTSVTSPHGALPDGVVPSASGSGGHIVPAGGPGASPATAANLSISHTLVLLNNSLRTGIFVGPNGRAPRAVVYDSGRGEYFVADGSGVVSVIAANNSTVVTSIPVDDPQGLAYDPYTNQVFVSDPTALGEVVVISDVSDRVTGSFAVPTPYGLTFDRAQRAIYAAGGGSEVVSVISDANDTVAAKIPVAGYPYALAYDPSQGEVAAIGNQSADLSVINDTLNRVVANVSVQGQGPIGGGFGVAWDPQSSDFFVSDYLTNNVSVVSGQNDTVVATIPVGNFPMGVAYAPSSGRIVVANFASDNVSLIRTSNDTVVSNPATGSGPTAIATGPGNGTIAVACARSQNLTELNSSSGRPTGSVSVGMFPFDAAVDSARGELYLTDPPSSNVSVISTTTSRVVRSIPVGQGPSGVAWDPPSDLILVANEGSNNLSVISGVTGAVVRSVPAGTEPLGVAVDPTTSWAFISDLATDRVSVVNVSNGEGVGSVPVGSAPGAVAYDPEQERVFVANFGSDTVSVIDSRNLTRLANITVGPGPDSLAWDASRGELFVADEGLGWPGQCDVRACSGSSLQLVANVTGVSPYASPTSIAYAPGTGSLLLSDNGSAEVSVISDRSLSVVASLGSQVDPFGVAFDPARGTGYLIEPESGSVAVLAGLAATFPITFHEQGLPGATAWNVSVDGSTYGSSSTNLTVWEPNGSHPYTIGTRPGFVAEPASGSLDVAGSPISVGINFTRTLTTINFNETGLPYGTLWSVRVNGTLLASGTPGITVELPSGPSYPYTVPSVGCFTPNPAAGVAPATNASVRIAVAFASLPCMPPPCPSLNFTESGLPPGTNWSVQVTAAGRVTSLSGTGPALTWRCAPSSSAAFVVGAIAGFLASPSNGSVDLTGSNEIVGIDFLPIPPLVAVATLVDWAGNLCPGGSLTMSLTGSATGGIAPYRFAWSFPDGSTSPSPTVEHTLSARPTGFPFLATLTVFDARGVSNTTSVPPFTESCVSPQTSLSPVFLIGGLGVAAGLAAVAAFFLLRRRPRA
jgi:YVTN family beta-propeller protein